MCTPRSLPHVVSFTMSSPTKYILSSTCCFFHNVFPYKIYSLFHMLFLSQCLPLQNIFSLPHVVSFTMSSPTKYILSSTCCFFHNVLPYKIYSLFHMLFLSQCLPLQNIFSLPHVVSFTMSLTLQNIFSLPHVVSFTMSYPTKYILSSTCCFFHNVLPYKIYSLFHMLFLSQCLPLQNIFSLPHVVSFTMSYPTKYILSSTCCFFHNVFPYKIYSLFHMLFLSQCLPLQNIFSLPHVVSFTMSYPTKYILSSTCCFFHNVLPYKIYSLFHMLFLSQCLPLQNIFSLPHVVSFTMSSPTKYILSSTCCFFHNVLPYKIYSLFHMLFLSQCLPQQNIFSLPHVVSFTMSYPTKYILSSTCCFFHNVLPYKIYSLFHMLFLSQCLPLQNIFSLPHVVSFTMSSPTKYILSSTCCFFVIVSFFNLMEFQKPIIRPR